MVASLSVCLANPNFPNCYFPWAFLLAVPVGKGDQLLCPKNRAGWFICSRKGDANVSTPCTHAVKSLLHMETQ